MPLTETGFKRRTYDEILQAKIEKAKELFGEDIETSELTPLGKYIRINAYDQALTEEEAEMIYYSIFPNTATGTSLDRLCVFAGIKRNLATCSQYTVTVTGTAGATIPQGFLVGTESEINFANKADTVIGENGTAEITVECVESGEIGNVYAAEITNIVNPAADIESVIGVEMVVKGQETESDYELRNRFTEAKEGLGSCNEVAIKAALLRVPTVTHAGIVINETDTTDSEGRPARSFECYVSGGENYHEQIAEAIFEKKPLGIKTYGKVAQEIIDNGGHTHTINFSHTASINVYVRIAINTNTEFEGTTGKEEIKNNLETYIDNIAIGKSVILSSLYGQIHSVAGVTEVAELLLSTDGTSWNANNILVAENESCVCYQVQIKQDGGEYEVIG